MAIQAISKHLPAIALARSDHERLSNLTDLLAERDPATADRLAAELERARVVADHRLPGNTVRMGAMVRFRLDGDEREVQLVYPGDADIGQGRISVLTPVGTALIGLRVGQGFDWVGDDGRPHRVDIAAVPATD